MLPKYTAKAKLNYSYYMVHALCLAQLYLCKVEVYTFMYTYFVEPVW
jgi:hypothetical protein